MYAISKVNELTVKNILTINVCFEYSLTKLLFSSIINANIGKKILNPGIKKLKLIRKAATLALKPAIDFCDLTSKF